VHVAHALKKDFGAGQLYVNLHGIDERPLDAGEVLEEFLRELGVEPSLIPRRVEGRARIYRTQLTGGRFLVLPDNAADEGQVRPLLPFAHGCAVLVTSRGRLAGLEGAEPVPLDVFDQEPAVALLGSIIGRSRLEAEPDAAREIVRLCGYLPLAVKVAGAKLASRPHWRIARLVERLQDEQTRLRELRIGDVEVRSVMAFSSSTRPDQERQTFRRLGLIDASSFPAWAVAALSEHGLREAEDLLENLAEAQIVEVVGEDPAGQMHYRLHDLLRAFAREQVLDEEPPADREAALRRYVTAYLAVTAAARIKLEPDAGDGDPWPLDHVAATDVLPDDPVKWFSFERANLTDVVRQAFDAGLATLGWRMLDHLSPFYEHQAYWESWREAAEAALEAATRSSNRRAEAQA